MYVNPNSQTQILSPDRLRQIAPSVFASNPWGGMSDRYKFVPTGDVLDIIAGLGFYPVKASQSKSRIPGKGEFTRHMLRLRHEDNLRQNVGEEFPELVLTNSHDGTSAYRFMSGIFRLVCSNGMVVSSADFGSISVKHSGGNDFEQRIIDATYSVVEDMPKTVEQIGEWKQLQLPPPVQAAYATAAHELLGETVRDHIKPEKLLQARRTEDAADRSTGERSLWTTFNTVQENLTKGGLTGFTERGRRTRTRPVKAVETDIRLNRALWVLTDELAKRLG
jgi:hypothetical protein